MSKSPIENSPVPPADGNERPSSLHKLSLLAKEQSGIRSLRSTDNQPTSPEAPVSKKLHAQKRQTYLRALAAALLLLLSGILCAWWNSHGP